MNKAYHFLSQLIDKNKAPSVQYLLFDKDQVIYQFQKGLADIKNQIPVADDTTYNLYSVTKTFTALAILQLAQKGKLKLDDPVSLHLQEFPYPGAITIQHLLSHTAGIPNPIPLNWIHLEREHASFNRDQFFESIFSKHKKVKFDPNEKFSYSNIGYVLLGKLIEVISGMNYEDHIHENIIQAIGLSANELRFKITDTDHQAKGYHKYWSISNWIIGWFIDPSRYRDKKEGPWQPFKPLYVNGTAYGGLIGTPKALMTYLQELLTPNCRLLSDEYKKMLFTEQYTNNNKATQMCLSWFKGNLMGHDYFYHPGGGGGYYVEARIYPEKGIGSVIMFNRSGMRDERFLDRLDKFYFLEGNI